MIDSVRQIDIQLQTAETLDDDSKHIVGESKTVPQIRTMVSPFDGEMSRPPLSGQAFYQLARLIRNDPTVRLVRELVMAPILRAGWSYECSDKAPEGALEKVKGVMDRMRIQLLKSSMSSCIDFGYAPYEIIVDSKWNIKVKPLLVDYTTILVNAMTGEFFGLKQQPLYNIGNTYAYLTRNECFIAAQDVEAGNLYGRATLESLVETYNENSLINKASRKYDSKVAGTHWVIYYPLGKSKFNGVDTDNGEIAKELLARAESVGGIMVPRSVLQALDTITAQAASNEATQWKIELLSDKGAGQMAFENKLKYLDVLKVRAFGVPERAILEGQYGTKAEAETHADIAIANLEVRHQSLVDLYNYELVNKILKWHYGYEFINSVYIKPTPIDDLTLSFNRQLYMQLLTDPNTAAQEQQHIDMAALRDSLSVPELQHNETAAGSVDEWLNEILNGDDRDVFNELGLSNFDPNQPRDSAGEWTDSGGGDSGGTATATKAKPKKTKLSKDINAIAKSVGMAPDELIGKKFMPGTLEAYGHDLSEEELAAKGILINKGEHYELSPQVVEHLGKQKKLRESFVSGEAPKAAAPVQQKPPKAPKADPSRAANATPQKQAAAVQTLLDRYKQYHPEKSGANYDGKHITAGSIPAAYTGYSADELVASGALTEVGETDTGEKVYRVSVGLSNYNPNQPRDSRGQWVYHGGSSDFEEFKPDTKNAWTDTLGFDTYFFSGNRATASSYANQFKDGVINQWRLNLKNPLLIDANGGEWMDALAEASDKIQTYRTPQEKEFLELKDNIYSKYGPDEELSDSDQETLSKASREMDQHIVSNRELYTNAQKKPYKYDGIIVSNVLDLTAHEPTPDLDGMYSPYDTVHIAFDPSGIEKRSDVLDLSQD